MGKASPITGKSSRLVAESPHGTLLPKEGKRPRCLYRLGAVESAWCIIFYICKAICYPAMSVHCLTGDQPFAVLQVDFATG